MNKPRITTIILILILILAAVTRIGWPGLTEFKADEAIPLRNGVLLLREGRIPPPMTSSVGGVPHPGLMAYLMALVWLVMPDPAAVVIFFGAMGVAAVALTYWLGARYFGEVVGLFAAALFAASPWAIFYTRKLWAMDVPLFTLILMIGLFKLIVERKWWGIAPALIMAVLLPGLYIGNLVFPVIVLIALALHWRAVLEAWRAASVRDRWLWSGITAVGIAILLALMHQWIGMLLDGRIALNAGESASGEFKPFAQMLLVFKIATSTEFHSLAGDAYPLYQRLLLANESPLVDGFVRQFMMMGMMLLLARIVKPTFFKINPSEPSTPFETRSAYALLAIWMFVPIIVWILSRLEPQPHRYIALYPTQFLALGLLFSFKTLPTERRERLRTIIAFAAFAVLLGGIMAWWLIQYSTLLRVVNTTVINGGHGAAAKWMWEAAREARRLAEPDSLPIMLNGTGDDPETEGEAIAFDAMLGDLNLWLVEGEAISAKTPDGYVRMDTRPDGHYTVELIEAADTSGEAAARLANGIEFVRVEPSRLAPTLQPGANVVISVVWRVWGLPPTSDNYSYTIQLYDQTGARHVNINGHFLRTDYWRVGDMIVTSGVLRIPGNVPADSTYHLVISLYHAADDGTITAVGVLNEGGGKIGEFIEVPLD